MHNLFAEDIFNMDHMPKYEEHEESVLFVLKNYVKSEGFLKKNHCSVYLKDNIIISFQEIPNDYLDKKIERISQGNGKTFEARSRRYGVGAFDARDRGWTHAGLIPGLEYDEITFEDFRDS